MRVGLRGLLEPDRRPEKVYGYQARYAHAKESTTTLHSLQLIEATEFYFSFDMAVSVAEWQRISAPNERGKKHASGGKSPENIIGECCLPANPVSFQGIIVGAICAQRKSYPKTLIFVGPRVGWGDGADRASGID